MAQLQYSIDLRETFFSLLSEQQGRTIIGKTVGESPTIEDKPRLAYCHNVMPSAYGMDSIGYLSIIPAVVLPFGVSFSDVRIAYGSAKSRIHLAWDNLGRVYVLIPGSTSWVLLSATSPVTTSTDFSNDSVTIATVNGVSYIFYSGIGAFTYNETTTKLDAVTLTGLTISAILGLVAASGYLVAYTSEAIAWSSTIDPTDFVPSQVTGAGGGNVAGIAGAILFITPNPLGFLVHTIANTIAATFTGNVQFPFKFRPIKNGKGGISLDLIAYEAESSEQFLYSKAGLQTVDSQRADTVLPEVTDFLAGRRFEDFNETTKLYETTDLVASETMKKKIKLIASRYLVISYGLPTSSDFTHALIYDLSLKKLGKIKTPHVDVFEYIGDQTEVAKETIAFVLSTGEVKALDFSATATGSGVVILGKLQATRTRMIDLLGVEVENVETGDTLSVDSQASLDGKTFTLASGSLLSSAEGLRTYGFRSSAKNHSLMFIGRFNLVAALVTYKSTGRR